jgi:hypothetical protein
MAWRKWLVRGFVFSVLGSAALAALAYQHLTSSDAVREQVLKKLRTIFPGAAIALDSAGLRLLGHIQVRELRLLKPAGREKHEFAHIPSALIYHDKEKLAGGEMVLRKVDMARPTLRVVRGADGRWNVQDVLAPSDPTKPLPTVVAHEATVLLEDRYDAARPVSLELRNVSLTFINDPLPTVTIDAVGHTELLGKIEVHAVWQRATNDIRFTVQAANVVLSKALLDRFGPCLCPAGKLESVALSGSASVRVQGTRIPGSAGGAGGEEPAWNVGVQVSVKKTTVQHPLLPLPVEELDAELRYAGGELHVHDLRGRLGKAVVSGTAVGRLPCPDEDFEASLTLAHLELCDSLGERLPDKLKALGKLFQPHGPASVHLHCARRGGEWVKTAVGKESVVTLAPENMDICFDHFPCPLSRVTGAVHYQLANHRVLLDLTAHAGERPVTIRGHWQGAGTAADADIDIVATDVPIEPALIEALPDAVEPYIRAFHAAGLVDVKAKVRHKPGETGIDYDYLIRAHGGTVRWEHFPITVKDVAGLVHITPNRWEFREFRGRHQDGSVSLSGRSLDVAPGMPAGSQGIFLEITGKNVPLDADLARAIDAMPPLAKAWEVFQPSGRLHFTAGITRRGPRPEDLDVRVDVKGSTVQPRFFAYALDEFAGLFHFHDLRLDLRRVSAIHRVRSPADRNIAHRAVDHRAIDRAVDESDTPPAQFYLETGSVEVHPQGALYVVLPRLQAQNLRLDDDFCAGLPPSLRGIVESLNTTDPLRLQTEIIVSHEGDPGSMPDVYWDGQLWFKDASVTTGVPLKHVTGTLASKGRHNGKQLLGLSGNLVLDRVAVFNQPFRNVKAPFHVLEKQPERLLLGLNAPIFGGDVTGQVALDFAETPRFELNLTASQIDLEQFGRHNLGAKSQISGIAVGRLVLSGVGSDLGTLDGHGTVDVPNGKLYNLPLLLDLIKFLGLRWPDRTMFEEAHAQFAIRGRRARIQNLELFGNAVSFTGKGEVGLDGSDLAIEMYPSWARIEQLLPPALRSMPPAVSKNILTVEAKGKITGNPDDIRFVKKPMPIIVDPLMHLRDRMIGAPGATPPRLAPARPVETPAPPRRLELLGPQ